MKGKKKKTALCLSLFVVVVMVITVIAPMNAAADEYDPGTDDDADELRESIENVTRLLMWLSPAVTAVLFVICLLVMQMKMSFEDDPEEAAKWKNRAIKVLAIGLVITMAVVIVGAFYGAI